MYILMKPNIYVVWSTSKLYHTAIFPKTMRRDQFTLILKFLHINDNGDHLFNKDDDDDNDDDDDDDGDWLHKIRPINELLWDRCQKVYQPGKNLRIDEPIILFKGRLHFRQFIRAKRSRFVVKLYELTTSDSRTLDLMIYWGKECIPNIFMECFLWKFHVLFRDNYNTSLSSFWTERTYKWHWSFISCIRNSLGYL